MTPTDLCRPPMQSPMQEWRWIRRRCRLKNQAAQLASMLHLTQALNVGSGQGYLQDVIERLHRARHFAQQHVGEKWSRRRTWTFLRPRLIYCFVRQSREGIW